MNPVLASAIVDPLVAGPIPTWSVTVWGKPPHDIERVYTVTALSDDAAAHEGLALFTAEMQNHLAKGLPACLD